MGITIDKAIKFNKNLKMYMEINDEQSEYKFLEENHEALDLAIDTMHKYQKIEQIVSDFRKYKKGITWGFGGEKYMQMVSEVVEDGNDTK